jgi:hypothetical protein
VYRSVLVQYNKCKIIGQPAADLGGIKRQFFSSLLREVAESTSLNLFDRNEKYFLPTVNQEAYNCGYFKLLGKLILHSVIQEGPGFPHFPPSIYNYICTRSIDSATEYLSYEDLPFGSKLVWEQVSWLY